MFQICIVRRSAVANKSYLAERIKKNLEIALSIFLVFGALFLEGAIYFIYK
jgi:hypothetical protein